MDRKKKKKTKKRKKISKTNVRRKQVSQKEGKFLIWYLPFLVFLILLLSFSLFSYLLFSHSYKEWEKEFENSDLTKLDYQNEQVDLEKKIIEYNEMTGQYAFVEFDQRESLFLFSQSLDESLPEWVEIEKTALETFRGNWRFFVKSKAFNISLPWIQISVSKEDAQSVDIYVEDMFFGNLSFKNIYLNSIVENTNRGLRRSIQLVNDGNFAGRVFENIELAQDSLIIRSRNIANF